MMSMAEAAPCGVPGGLAGGIMLDAGKVHPGWWRSGVAGLVPDAELLRWLMDSQRTRVRLFARLVHSRRVPLEPVAAESTAGKILALDEADFERLLCRLGLAWNATRLAREIDRSALQRIVERVGEDDFRRILSGGLPEGRAPGKGSDSPIDPERLDREGAFCVRLWIAGGSHRAERQLALRLPPEAVIRTRASNKMVVRARKLVEHEVWAND